MEAKMRSARYILAAYALLGLTAFLKGAQANSEIDITGYYNEKDDGAFTRITKNGDLYQFLQHIKPATGLA